MMCRCAHAHERSDDPLVASDRGCLYGAGLGAVDDVLWPFEKIWPENDLFSSIKLENEPPVPTSYPNHNHHKSSLQMSCLPASTGSRIIILVLEQL